MRKLKQRTDQALTQATELGDLAALLDTWQPEALETDLWPQIVAQAGGDHDRLPHSHQQRWEVARMISIKRLPTLWRF